MLSRKVVAFLIVLGLAHSRALCSDEQDRLHVGVQPDGRIVVPTNQILHPAGKQIAFPGRAVDLALTEDGLLIVKNMKDLVFIDPNSATVKQTLPLPKPLPHEESLGFSVVGLLYRKGQVYVSDTRNYVRVATRNPNGSYQWSGRIEASPPAVGGVAHPAGIASSDGSDLWVTSTRGNSIQRIHPASGKVEQVISVGVAPYMLCF